MNRKQLQNIVDAVANHADDSAYIARVITETIQNNPDIKPGWALNLTKLLTLCTGKPIKSVPFSVFAEGNSKLPFLSFSGCPGALFVPAPAIAPNGVTRLARGAYPAAFVDRFKHHALVY